jgi:hypothetical protein
LRGWVSVTKDRRWVLQAESLPSQSHRTRRGPQATFAASNVDVTERDTPRTGTLAAPRSRNTGLQACSDKVQLCLTDHHGFAFACFRKCNDAGAGDISPSGFVQKSYRCCTTATYGLFSTLAQDICSIVPSPRASSGSIIGPTVSFDFRSVFHDRNFQLARLDAMEYRITGSDTVAACSA